MRLRLYFNSTGAIGGATIADTTALLLVPNVSDREWRFDAMFTVRAIGATTGRLFSDAVFFVVRQSGTVPDPQVNFAGQGVALTIDTTVANTFELTVDPVNNGTFYLEQSTVAIL